MEPRKKITKPAPSAPAPMRLVSPAVNDAPPPTRERIAQRAYELFLARGGEAGREEEDWFSAERELLHRE